MRFTQVDVFTADPLLGNPLAVVHDADHLTTEQMAAFARWTNLSETAFLLTPTDPAADYRVRIFTPAGELDFAGHPTLGSAHAWLEAGGTPRDPRPDGHLAQQCGIGLVRLRHTPRLAFAAPPLPESLPRATTDQLSAALRLDPSEFVEVRQLDIGPGWTGVLLSSADKVLEVQPHWSAFGGINIGLVGLHPTTDEAPDSPAPNSPAPNSPAVEVRGLFSIGESAIEDPVTGSLHAGVAHWLTASGHLPSSYVASQGRCVQRDGRVHLATDESGTVWVGGDVVTVVSGEYHL